MDMSAGLIQVRLGMAYLNVEESGGCAISAQGCGCASVIHLLAWNKGIQACYFSLLCIEKKDFDYWVSTHREKYGEVVQILSGETQSLPSDRKCRVCGTKEDLHFDGQYGYRCNRHECLCF
jgi:hypothetical protein